MDEAASEILPPSHLFRFDPSSLPVTDADEEASSPGEALWLLLSTITRSLPGI